MNIFLTGGSGGIGGAIVRLLGKDPTNRIYFTFNQDADSAAALEREFPSVKALRCDLADPAQLEGIKNELAGVDIDAVVNNAFAKLELKNVGQTEWSDVEHHLAVGVRSSLEFSRAFSRGMKLKKKGAIVTVLSSAVVGTPPPGMAPYLIAKYALLGVHQALAADLSPYGVRVNAVSPSMVKTGLLSNVPDHYVNRMEAAAPGGRLTTPEEVAAAVAYLLSNAAPEVNGANLTISAAPTP